MSDLGSSGISSDSRADMPRQRISSYRVSAARIAAQQQGSKPAQPTAVVHKKAGSVLRTLKTNSVPTITPITRTKLSPSASAPKSIISPQQIAGAVSTTLNTLVGEGTLSFPKIAPKPSSVSPDAQKAVSSQSQDTPLLKAVLDKDFVAFRQLLSTLQSHEIEEQIPQLLKALSEKVDSASYYAVLKELRTSYPKIENFIDSEGVLTPGGVRAVIEHLREKGSIAKTMFYQVCDSMDEFEIHLKELSQKENVTCCVIARCNLPDGHIHYIPFYIEKKGRRLQGFDHRESWKNILFSFCYTVCT